MKETLISLLLPLAPFGFCYVFFSLTLISSWFMGKRLRSEEGGISVEVIFKSIFLAITLSFVLFTVGVMLVVDLVAYKFKF